MPDITDLILTDHETFRRQFAALDDLHTPEELERVWRALADLLDLHAVAEERIFYPELIHRGSDAEDETLDAVGDHNEIRDATHEADLHPTGSAAWHEAVRKARAANTEHMGEEEDGALADFRKHADPGLREELGRKFLAFKQEHPDASGLDTSDVSPQAYVSKVEEQSEDKSQETPDGSLGIGSLKDGGNT